MEHACTSQELESIIQQKLSAQLWKIIYAVGIPIIAFAVAWGGLYIQVQNNSEAIKSQVLTVKDKTTLDVQIANLSAKIDNVSQDVREIKNSLH